MIIRTMRRIDPRNVAICTQADIATYVELAQAAQVFLRSRGLEQWVPAAHPDFLPSIVMRVERHSLHKVSEGDNTLAFFDFSFKPSEWWSSSAEMAGYISGIVVARESSGCGVGTFVVNWAEQKARAGGAQYLRLDCHADNSWLCEYYRSKGFIEVARIEQYPGYVGAIYQKCVRLENA